MNRFAAASSSSSSVAAASTASTSTASPSTNTTPAVTATATTNASASSANVSAMEAEIKKLKADLEEANKRYDRVNQLLQERNKEVDQLKSKRAEARSEAAKKVEQGAQSIKNVVTTTKTAAAATAQPAAPRQSVMRAPRASVMKGADGANPRQSIRPGSGGAGGAGGAGSRQSVMKPKINPTEMLTLLLDQMTKLETRMKKAEGARLQAENELLEMAVYKQNSDDMCNATISLLKEKLQELATVVTDINGCSSSCSDAAVKSKLTAIETVITKVKKDLEGHLSNQQTVQAVSSRVFGGVAGGGGGGSSIAPSSPTVKPAAPAPPPPKAPPAPSLAKFAGGKSSSNLNFASAGSRTSTLMSQIRRGKELNKIDMQEIQKDREKTVRSCRKSMAMLASLQDTLRAALGSRTDALFGTEDEYEDEDDDYWDD
eukprot:TRINITY_DN3696_c0_g1_i2.p1 TRINITY_DN3696_c0_g1~~TRINITY_DN3696_c0_g1_i2.p1  ORF type:complete len:430 (+),score=119.13 TRINITY_DN3696_c0_g1_i2:1145-2434(+)